MLTFLHELAEWLIAISSLGALIFSIVNKRAINEVHLTLNSRLSQLIKVTAASAHAEGRLEGVEAGRQEQSDAGN